MRQAVDIGLRRSADGGALVEQPQPRGVGIDPQFTAGGLVPLRAVHENVLQKRVQKLMHARVDRDEWYLMTMRVAERDHTQVIALVYRGYAGQAPPVIPVHRNAIGQNEVDGAALYPGCGHAGRKKDAPGHPRLPKTAGVL